MASPISMCMGTRLCMTKHKSIRAHTAGFFFFGFLLFLLFCFCVFCCCCCCCSPVIVQAATENMQSNHSMRLVINPFTSPACKISGLKDVRIEAPSNIYIFRSYNPPTFNATRFEENPFTCHCKKQNRKA